MSFAYNGNIPNPPDNPSNDVGTMQTNATSISNLIAVDHNGFNLSYAGTHKQAQLKELPGSSPPAGLLGTGYETLYAQVATTAGVTEGEVFFVRGASLSGVQLTGPQSNATNGFTFLPGGLLLQWGQVTTTGGSTGPFNFPKSFSGAPYSLMMTAVIGTGFTFGYVNTISPATQFTIQRSPSTGGNVIVMYMVIGPS